MKRKVYSFTIVVLTVALLLSTVLFFSFRNNASVFGEGNVAVWKNYNDAEIAADENGNTVSANGALYCADPLEMTDGESGEKSVKIEYSLKKETDTTHQFKFVFTSETIENYASYKDKLGTTANYIGFALVYGSGKYSTKTIQYGASSDAGNWKNNLYATFDPVDEAKHTLEMFFSSAGVRAKIDGADFVKQNTSEPYYFVKKDGSNYTISDFTNDGVLRVYLGIDGAYSFKTTVYTGKYINPEKPDDDFIGWKRGDGEKINKSEDNTIEIAFGAKGLLYTGNVAGINGVYADNKIEFETEFSYISSGRESNQLIPFISKTLYETSDSANESLNAKTEGIAGVRTYYQTADALTAGKLLIRASDGTSNYASVKYYENKPSDDGARHKYRFVITETETRVYFDDVYIDYDLKKPNGEKYALSDFIEGDKPVLYFGFINGGFGKITVYSDWHADEVEEPDEPIVPIEPEPDLPSGLPYDNEAFRNSSDKAIVPDSDGSVAFPDWVGYYYGNLGNVAFYEENNAIRVKINLSVDSFGNGAMATAMAHILFSNKGIENGVKSLPSQYGKEDGTLIDLTLRFADANAVKDNTMTARILDCAWGSSSTFSVTEKSVFTVQLDVNEDGAVLSFNGKQIGGYLYKSTGVKWKLSDFMKTVKDGEEEKVVPQVYFGFVCGADGYGKDFGPYRVHSIETEYSDGELPVEINGFKGVAETLKNENGKTLLVGGEAYTAKTYDNAKILKGTFEITNAPEAENTEFEVIVTDSVNSRNSGYGISVRYSRGTENEEEITVIDFGVYSDGKHYSVGRAKAGIKLIGMHNFAFVFGNGYYTVIADGESVYLGFMSSGALIETSDNLDTGALYIYYGADHEFFGKDRQWIVALEEAEATEDGEYLAIGAKVEAEGECIVDKKHVSENKTYTIENSVGARTGTFILRTPMAVFPKENVQFLVKINLSGLGVNDAATLIFSVVEGGSVDTENEQSFILKITRLENNVYKFGAKMGMEMVVKEISSENGEFLIVFGFTETGSAISVNDKIILNGNLSKGMFVSAAGQNGYFSVKTESNSENPGALSLKVKAPVHYEGDVPNKTDEIPADSGCACTSSVVKAESALIAVLAVAAVYIALKKKKA